MAARKNKSLYINLAKISITVILLVVVAATVDLRQVWRVVSQASWQHLALAWVLYQAGILVRSYRWQELLRANDAEISFLVLVKLYYVGTFFNSFLPTGFGGDVIKMYELSRGGADGEVAVSTVLADRVVGLAALFAMALLVIPFSLDLAPASVILVLVGIIIVFVLAISLLYSKRLISLLTSRIGLLRRVMQKPGIAAFYASLDRYTWRAIRKALAASLLFNISIIAVYYMLGLAVGVHISILYYFIFIPIISSVMVLPISVSGLGVREGGYVLLFGQAGVGQPLAVAMSLLYYGLNLVTGAAGGFVYLIESVLATRSGRNVRGL